MNIYRSALSACIVKDLPNARDYVYKHRERLLEDLRQNKLAMEIYGDLEYEALGDNINFDFDF